MRRNRTRTPRNNIATIGQYGHLTSLGHRLVFPGETLQKHKVSARIQSAPVGPMISGAYIDLFTFYVPLRLIWPEFPEWLLEPNTEVSPGTVSTDDIDTLTQSGDLDWPVLARDAILENFFTMEKVSRPSGRELNLPHPEISFEVGAYPGENVPNEKVEVSNGEWKLKDLDKARFREARSEWLLTVGNSYPTYLKEMGVNVTELHMMPEYLGGARKWVYPSRTIDQDTGYSVQSYMTDVQFNRDRKNAFFPEHGILVDYVAIRPKIYPNNGSEWPKLRPSDFMPDRYPGDVAEDLDFRHLFEHGEFFIAPGINAGSQKVAFHDIIDPEFDRGQMMYPNWVGINRSDGIGSENRAFVADAKTSSSIRTWLDRPGNIEIGPNQFD